jgi:hypothetical protein
MTAGASSRAGAAFHPVRRGESETRQGESAIVRAGGCARAGGVIRLLLAPAPCALALAAVPARAQQQDAQAWLQVNTNVPVAKDVRVTLEQIARVSHRSDGLYQVELGALVGWKASKAVELGFGYRFATMQGAGAGANEHRLRQQVVATFGRLTSRLRIDERFHPGGDEIGFRVRPLIRYNQPLGRTGLVAFASHESFWLPNATAWGQQRGYERMRNIVGLAVPVTRGLAADVGYLNQFRPGRGGSRDRMDHALTVQLTINLSDLTHASVHD